MTQFSVLKFIDTLHFSTGLQLNEDKLWKKSSSGSRGWVQSIAGFDKNSFSCFLFPSLSFMLSQRTELTWNQRFHSGVRFKKSSHASCILEFSSSKERLSALKQSTISKQRLICAFTPCLNCIFLKNRRKKSSFVWIFLLLFLPKERLVNQPVKFIFRFWA